MKYFATTDVAASIRKAHEEFTHVLVNRSYETLRKVYFKSGRIRDLPVYSWASWEPASVSQVSGWQENGGVMLDRNTFSDRSGPADVLVLVECPLKAVKINRSSEQIAEYVVVPRPHTWRMHEFSIDMRTPPVDKLRTLWEHCRGKRMTDIELAEVTGISEIDVQYMRAGLKPAEEWEMRPRFAPDHAGFTDAWEWIGAGRHAGLCASRKGVREAGHKLAVKEMARLGHIVLEKRHRYPDAEPDWDRLERKRAAALAGLAAVRSLVESLPDHLQT